jgi:hypothetical protein
MTDLELGIRVWALIIIGGWLLVCYEKWRARRGSKSPRRDW